MEAKAIFLNPFIIFSSCKRKFVVVRLFPKKETEDIRLQVLNFCKHLKEYLKNIEPILRR
jgi:hypothetical protein